MRYKILVSIFICAFAASDLFSEVKIIATVGPVAAMRSGVWREARMGDGVSHLDKIKTASNSQAVLLDGESKIYVRENSEMEVKSPSKDESVFSLIMGKIRAKVKLAGGSKFRVVTPVAVASVRGTDFGIDSYGELVVFEGAVEFSDIMMSQSITVESGNLAKLDETGLPIEKILSADELQSRQNEWQETFNGALEEGKRLEEKSDEKVEEDEKTKRDDVASELAQIKQELREMIRDVKADIVVARDITNEIKQADISSGRTLTDRFGNLVRVEQQFLRPEADTIQFVNITKRDSYRYAGFFKDAYSGTTGHRMDICNAKIKFSENLPDAMTDWPKYFFDRGDNIKLESAEVTLTNRKDSYEIKARRKVVDGKDDMKSEIFLNGWKINESYNSIAKSESMDDGGEELYIWAKSPEMKIERDGQTKYVSVWTEAYAINNSGGLLTKNTFVGGETNPFKLFKEIALQNVIFVKEVEMPTQKDALLKVKGDFFEGRNIDLIFTPDIVIAMASKMASGLSRIKFSSGINENKSPKSLIRL